MTTLLNPYLSFRDNAREAMTFYQSIFGGDLTTSTFGEYGASQDPAEQDKVMHAHLTTPSGLVLMASDTPNSMELPAASNISVSISGDDADALRSYWDGLTADGTVTMPLEPAPWGDTFGMCTDRFGTNWLVSISEESAGQPTN
jgi:PhnB protein